MSTSYSLHKNLIGYSWVFFSANTSNFLAHIKSSHPDYKRSGSSSGLKQMKLTGSFGQPKQKPKGERKKSLDDALMQLVVGKVLPLSLVDNKFFKAFVSMLDPE